MASKLTHIDDLPQEQAELRFRSHCSRCGFDKPSVSIKYSYGIYAGRYCDECAIAGFNDGCGLVDGQQGNPYELGECVDED
jgi:hypothetical protein